MKDEQITNNDTRPVAERCPLFSITGIVLAAGRGLRFDPTGQRFKLTASLGDDQPVIVATCKALAGHVDRLLVVEGPRAHELDPYLDPGLNRSAKGVTVKQGNIDAAARPRQAAVERIFCPDADAGMGASLKAGVQASLMSDGWLIALGDMPYVSINTIRLLCNALRDGAQIVRPSYRGQPGHPVGFAQSFRDTLLAIPDKAGAAALLRHHHSHVRLIMVADSGCITDIDYPNDILPLS